MEFKVGDRIVGREDSRHYNIKRKEGTIIEIRHNELLVEFDKYINGHDGNWNVHGKDGHCWHVHQEDIELVKTEITLMDYIGDKFKNRKVSVIKNGIVYKLVKNDGKVLYTYVPTKEIKRIVETKDKTERLYITLFVEAIQTFETKKEQENG